MVVRVKRIDWSDDVAKHLSTSAGQDLLYIAAEVEAGISKLWECQTTNGFGYVVTRIEESATGYELVLVLGEGKGFDEFIPYIINFCKDRGLGFRTHVKRKGLIKMYQRHGVGLQEYVLGFV